MKRKITFLTGTRADYGKIKSILQTLSSDTHFITSIFVTGMHLEEKFGSTYNEIIKDNFLHIFLDKTEKQSTSMNGRLGSLIVRFDQFVKENHSDMIVVHGDRLEALAGAIVGAFNNILVAHIEGGEITGTIDESIKHAISKFAHLHFVANEEAKTRLIQLGEIQENIHIIGSPDIDIMLSPSLPPLQTVLQHYDIPFKTYALVLYHPVVTELEKIKSQTQELVNAINASQQNFVIIYPNNDDGSEEILAQYTRLISKKNSIKIVPSFRFEYFLTLLKQAAFILGNSSAGVREACVYGIPAIDLGTRQAGRYKADILKNIIHLPEYTEKDILLAMSQVEQHRYTSSIFGSGNSAQNFHSILCNELTWQTPKQKKFIDFVLS
ncbi:MAG: UDP-N-acetylglucosamine 2-epimerase [Pseudomonadota bacterium]